MLRNRQIDFLANFPGILVESDIINAMGRNIVKIREENEKKDVCGCIKVRSGRKYVCARV